MINFGNSPKIGFRFLDLRNVIKEKKAELHTISDSAKPDITLGNVSWLTPDIKNSERIIDTCYGEMPMVFSKTKSLSIVPFFTVKLP